MDKLIDAFLSSIIQPQVFSLLLVTLILTILSIIIYVKSKKQVANKAPKGFLSFVEQYVTSIDKLYVENTEGKLQKPAPYIFTLITFLALGNLLGLLGFEVPVSSYSVALTLGLISWIGIYVVGITYQKMRFFRKFLNPLELVGQFAPLISISFRIFGNIIGGSTILYLIYFSLGSLWSNIPVLGEINILGSIFAPAFHFYFDVFNGLIQAYVFTLLTMVYWTIEAEVPVKNSQKRVKIIKKAEKGV